MAQPGYVMLQGGSFRPAEISVNAINFNGSNSTIEYADSWVQDLSTEATISFWIKPAMGASETLYLIATHDGTTRQYIQLWSNGSTQLRVLVRHTATGSSDGIVYASAYGSINNNAWNHVVYTFKATGNVFHMAINDTDLSASNGENGTNTFPGTTTLDTIVGNFTSGSFYYEGCLAEFYVVGKYYDITSQSNRLKFISAGNKPVALPGSPGLVYLNGNASAWTNSGSSALGTQTKANITDCADSPSD